MNGTTMTGTGGTRRRNRLRPFVWGGAACLLLLPALAMRLRPQSGVDWSALDFAVMGTMLALCCGAFELALRVARNPAYLLASGIAVAAAFLSPPFGQSTFGLSPTGLGDLLAGIF